MIGNDIFKENVVNANTTTFYNIKEIAQAPIPIKRKYGKMKREDIKRERNQDEQKRLEEKREQQFVKKREELEGKIRCIDREIMELHRREQRANEEKVIDNIENILNFSYVNK